MRYNKVRLTEKDIVNYYRADRLPRKMKKMIKKHLGEVAAFGIINIQYGKSILPFLCEETK